MLDAGGKLLDRETVIADVLEREKTMSTGMAHGIALPHAKTDGVADTIVAVGVKKEGVNFESLDGEPSRLFILIVSPKKAHSIHVQFLAAVGSILGEEEVRETVINSVAPDVAVDLIRMSDYLLHNKKKT